MTNRPPAYEDSYGSSSAGGYSAPPGSRPVQRSTTPPRISDEIAEEIREVAGDLKQALSRTQTAPTKSAQPEPESDRPASRWQPNLRFVSAWLAQAQAAQAQQSVGRDLKRNYVLLFCCYMSVGLLCSKVGLGGQLATRPIAVMLHNLVLAPPVVACQLSAAGMLFIWIRPSPRMERRTFWASVIYLFAYSLYMGWLGGLPE